jgi:hypothetical protein
MKIEFKINTKLFTINEIVSKFNYGKTLQILANFEEIVRELEEEREVLSNMEVVPELTIKDIDKQLRYLALNINTLKDVIKYHEDNSLENLMTSMGISSSIPKN